MHQGPQLLVPRGRRQRRDRARVAVRLTEQDRQRGDAHRVANYVAVYPPASERDHG
jgi:hypothetical protein